MVELEHASRVPQSRRLDQRNKSLSFRGKEGAIKLYSAVFSIRREFLLRNVPCLNVIEIDFI